MLEPLTAKSLHTLLLALADDEFIYGYRNSEWTGIAPMLEEDVAFSSMSQDEIGHARILYEMLSAETGIHVDTIAYGRQPHEYLSCRLMDARWLDWAHAIARQFLYDMADHVRLEALSRSAYKPLADAVQKIVREEKYHLMHADLWLTRLATLSSVSRDRLVDALNEVWPYAPGVFESLPGEEQLVAEGFLPVANSNLQIEWLERLALYFYNLDLPFPAHKDQRTGLYTLDFQPLYGGRQGQHDEEFVRLWEEMTEVYRLDPEAVW